MLNNVRSLQKSCKNFRNFTSTKNARHGHDHAHEHKPLGPYEVPHHATYSKEAHLFGIDPTKPYTQEGWEVLTFVTYTLMFGIIFGSAATKDLDSFKVSISHSSLNINDKCMHSCIFNMISFISCNFPLFALCRAGQEEKP